MDKDDYQYYNHDDESTRPDTLPDGCEYRLGRDWLVEDDDPKSWQLLQRRWPAKGGGNPDE